MTVTIRESVRLQIEKLLPEGYIIRDNDWGDYEIRRYVNFLWKPVVLTFTSEDPDDRNDTCWMNYVKGRIEDGHKVIEAITPLFKGDIEIYMP